MADIFNIKNFRNANLTVPHIIKKFVNAWKIVVYPNTPIYYSCCTITTPDNIKLDRFRPYFWIDYDESQQEWYIHYKVKKFTMISVVNDITDVIKYSVVV